MLARRAGAHRLVEMIEPPDAGVRGFRRVNPSTAPQADSTTLADNGIDLVDGIQETDQMPGVGRAEQSSAMSGSEGRRWVVRVAIGLFAGRGLFSGLVPRDCLTKPAGKGPSPGLR